MVASPAGTTHSVTTAFQAAPSPVKTNDNSQRNRRIFAKEIGGPAQSSRAMHVVPPAAQERDVNLRGAGHSGRAFSCAASEAGCRFARRTSAGVSTTLPLELRSAAQA